MSKRNIDPNNTRNGNLRRKVTKKKRGKNKKPGKVFVCFVLRWRYIGPSRTESKLAAPENARACFSHLPSQKSNDGTKGKSGEGGSRPSRCRVWRGTSSVD